ncbi:unnamed protein product, partial [Mesorhabditis belari]|uniref:SHSP domain-containing protein n=1 Tax=Mesorhabditis belari TaxID=2138241 RepID=A0AAF3FQA9_9BILA
MALMPHNLGYGSRWLDRYDPFERMMTTTPYWFSVPHARHLDIGNSIGNISNDANHFAVDIDCAHFRPEEIKVNVDGNKLSIEGHHEERNDQHGTIQRTFKRSYVLPEDCIMDHVASYLSSDGKLTIDAPKKGAVGGSSRAIPIQPRGPYAVKDN